jgi:type I restriction-modification system DNA methylase subunit
VTDAASQGLVGPSDIADIAGVSRSAVSNWRKRAGDFPNPVGGSSAQPLFSREEVTRWLVSHGYTPKADHGETAVWAAMNALRDELSADDAAQVILSLTCARKLTDQTLADDLGGMRWADLASLRPGELRQQLLELFMRLDPAENLLCGEVLTGQSLNPQALARVVDMIAEADPSHLDAIADFVLERLAKAQGKMGADHGFVGSRTSALLARLAAAGPTVVLYDAACGIAAALLAAVEGGARPLRIVGHDINGQALRIARQRALLHEVHIDLVQTDVLREDIDPELRADVVIAEPPLGLRLDSPEWLTDRRFQFGAPPRMSADTAWLQHVIAHLTETGRGYVLTSSGALFREEERAVRTALVRSGCVEAIVGLPGKMLPHTAVKLALWVLRRPTPVDAASQILLIDAAEEEAPEANVAAWIQPARERLHVPHVIVPITDVLAGDSVLTPKKWTAGTDHDTHQVSRAYAEEIAALDRALRELQHTHVSYAEPGQFVPSRVLTVGELIERKVLDLRNGKPADRYKDLPARTRARIVTAGDVRDGTLEGAVADAALEKLPEMTRPGDVLVTTWHTVRARVDEAGFHIPSTGVHRLRILDHNVLFDHYLALALTGSWNARFQAGSTIQRAAIRDLEIPLIPIQDQRNTTVAVDFMKHLSETGTTLARQADIVSGALLDAIRYNVHLPLAGSQGEDEA